MTDLDFGWTSPARAAGKAPENTFGGTAPPGRPYELVLAEVEPGSGRVLLRSRELFPHGARTGDEARLAVRCPPGDGSGTALAVVTWHDAEPRLVSIHSVRLRPGVHELRAVLAGPGRIEFTDPPGARPDPRGWRELVGTVPERVDLRAAEADVVCGIELGGAAEQVRRRISLVRELIVLLAEACPEPGAFRAAVVGYADHDFDSRAGERRPLRGRWLAGPDEALDALDALRPVEPVTSVSAPVEDMLEAVATRLTRQRAGRRTTLLTVGARPPHPPQANEQAIQPCPFGHRWDVLLDRICRHDPGVVRLAVADRPHRHEQWFWQRMGADGFSSLAQADPRELGTRTGLVAPRGQALPLPLIHDDRGDS